MCTVTYIPLKEGFVLTSARDEKSYRPTRKPQAYTCQDKLLVYPKDESAGGTWIAASDQKKTACLLNGGFENHQRKDFYARSRGLVLLESFNHNSFTEFIAEIKLDTIEPFTLLLIEYDTGIEFNQLVWDGSRKHVQKIKSDVPGIWSSTTLYSEAERVARKKWFNNWLARYKEDENKNIPGFYYEKHSENERQNILMKRDNGLQTVSISRVIVTRNNTCLTYHDLQDHSKTEINLAELKCTQDLP